MKRKNAEQTAAQAVGTRSEMAMELGVRKGVGYISQRSGSVTDLQAEGVLLCSPKCQGCMGEPKRTPLHAARRIYVSGHTAHVAEWKTNFEDLTM